MSCCNTLSPLYSSAARFPRGKSSYSRTAPFQQVGSLLLSCLQSETAALFDLQITCQPVRIRWGCEFYETALLSTSVPSAHLLPEKLCSARNARVEPFSALRCNRFPCIEETLHVKYILSDLLRSRGNIRSRQSPYCRPERRRDS